MKNLVNLKFLFLALVVVGQSVMADANGLLSNYAPVQKALSGDDVPSGRKHADALKVAAEKFLADLGQGHAQAANVSLVVQGSDAVVKSQTDKDARTAFGTLARGIIEIVRKEPALQSQWQLFFCPMTKPYGFWVQPMGEKITNPYWGSQMLHCGSKKKW